MKILHLEDNDKDAELICLALHRGFLDRCVTRVETREAFVEALAQDDWDIILADYALLGFDGVSAMRIAAQRLPEVPFIFVTGFLGEERAVEILRSGATDYIVKARLDLLVPAIGRAARDSENSRAKNRAERNLKSSLNEKELLLQELHHRVNNNLQVICSLLKMQAAALDDPTLVSAFKESEGRVQSMAMVHSMLYASDNLKEIDFAAYAEAMAAEIASSYGRDKKKIKLTLNLEPVLLAINEAIPCGLILNELLSNSFKYAFPNGNDGEVVVSLSRRGSGIRMAVEDTGVGLPSNHHSDGRKSLGMTIIQILARQLGGSMDVTSDHGCHFVLNLALPVSYFGTTDNPSARDEGRRS